MKQVWIPKHGRPEVLEVRQVPDPTPEDNEVQIEVHFSGVNFADILARIGLYPDAPKIPCVVGYEVSGVVEKVGLRTEDSWNGKRVAAFTRFGGYSSRVCVPVDHVIVLGAGVSLEMGAAMPVTYVTAYLMMADMANLKAGETVLIHNVGGGVGISAFQIARIIGATVIGTASGWKHDVLRRMGVEYLIDYGKEDFVSRTQEITGGKGVDLVLDPIAGKNLGRSYRCLRPFGRVVAFGASSMVTGRTRNLFAAVKMFLSTKRFHLITLMNDNRGILGCNLGHLWNEREKLPRAVQQLTGWLNEGKIQPVVDRVFSFEEAAAAHRYIQDRRNIGKVLLSPKL